MGVRGPLAFRVRSRALVVQHRARRQRGPSAVSGSALTLPEP